MKKALIETRFALRRKCFTCLPTSARQRTVRCSTTLTRPKHKRTLGPFAFGSIVACGVAGAVALTIYNIPVVHAEAPPDTSSKAKIRLADVKKHGRNSEEKWVVKGTKVYNITEWIPGHPGGEVILRAVGGTIDKYWDIFSIHKKQDVYDILEEYYIGELDPQDLENGQVPQDDVDDPFDTDPKRDPRLKVHSAKPCNAETPEESLHSYITPPETFYVRNHLWVPVISDDDDHNLHVELQDGTEISYTIADLKSKFEPVTITATLECSGNRRDHMSQGARAAQGLPWGVGGISNAEWTGVRLRDVLAHAGFPVDDWDVDEVKHAQFMGAEAYGASIPIEKAVSRLGDVLLVYEMGGKPLAPDHGYPLRLLCPGHAAARSVKWLNKIILSEEESQSQWQQRDYKCFGPNQGGHDVDWTTAPAIQEIPVQSAITSLRDVSFASGGADRKTLQVYGLEEDAVEVEGYALSGGGRRIVRVDVSADDGKTWHQAEILEDEAKGHKSWAWRRWKWIVPRRLVGRVFVVKAVDDGYNVQPDSYEPHYNFKGNLTSGWHRVGFQSTS